MFSLLILCTRAIPSPILLPSLLPLPRPASCSQHHMKQLVGYGPLPCKDWCTRQLLNMGGVHRRQLFNYQHQFYPVWNQTVLQNVQKTPLWQICPLWHAYICLIYVNLMRFIINDLQELNKTKCILLYILLWFHWELRTNFWSYLFWYKSEPTLLNTLELICMCLNALGAQILWIFYGMCSWLVHLLWKYQSLLTHLRITSLRFEGRTLSF